MLMLYFQLMKLKNKPFGVKANHICDIMTNTKKFTQIELDILEATVPDSVIIPFKKEILDLCESFGDSGQSGALGAICH